MYIYNFIRGLRVGAKAPTLTRANRSLAKTLSREGRACVSVACVSSHGGRLCVLRKTSVRARELKSGLRSLCPAFVAEALFLLC